jgi:F0F1-type ATP synthase beta subunit
VLAHGTPLAASHFWHLPATHVSELKLSQSAIFPALSQVSPTFDCTPKAVHFLLLLQ